MELTPEGKKEFYIGCTIGFVFLVIFGIYVLLCMAGFFQGCPPSPSSKQENKANQRLREIGYKFGYDFGKIDAKTANFYGPEVAFREQDVIADYIGKLKEGSDFDYSNVTSNPRYKEGFLQGYKDGWDSVVRKR